jgi:hypothetical protein
LANFGEFPKGEVRRMEILRRKPLPSEEMETYDVSRAVWNYRIDTPSLIKPVTQA